MSAERMKEEDFWSRVSLRPFRVTDAEEMLSYMNDPKMGRYTALPWKEGGMKLKSEVESFIQSFCIPYRYCRSICISDRSVGMAILSPMGEEGSWQKGSIGLAVSPSHWAKGVGKRALELVVAEVFTVIPEIVRLEAYANVENVASQKMVERVGFQREGVLRKFFFIRGQLRDVVAYSMLADDEKRLALLKSLTSRL